MTPLELLARLRLNDKRIDELTAQRDGLAAALREIRRLVKSNAAHPFITGLIDIYLREVGEGK